MRGRPALLVFLGTLGCLFLAVGFQFLLFRDASGEAFGRSLLMAVALPILTGSVIFLLIRPALKDLARLSQRYVHAIAHDSLTSCLNGAVFSAMVESHPSISGSANGQWRGAFLVIDVDDLSSINSSAGHRAGDDALRIIAGIIRASVRNDDIVGRLGGEEFGVFLPGATKQNAESVADRIRHQVSEVDFGGGNWALSVSVGAVLFAHEIEFDDLVRVADKTLQRAKERGRNSIEYAQLPSDLPLSESPLH